MQVSQSLQNAVGDERARPAAARAGHARRPPLDWTGYGWAVAVTVAATVVGWLLYHGPRLPDETRHPLLADANVLIYERIREELRNGMSPNAAINAGFDKAFSAIADSNVTTLIAGIVLLTFGTGPVRGFAVTLCLGIATSMVTAILGSRALIHLIWGRRRKLASLPI